MQTSAPGIAENGNISILGTVTAGSFQGNGASLSNVNAITVQGYAATYFLNANNLNTGTLADARLGTNVALLNATSWNYSGNLTVAGATTLASLIVNGNSTFSGSITITGAANLATLTVAGNATVDGTLTYGKLQGKCSGLANYIWVPGSAKYGTMPGFCVMKYQAKDDGSGNAVSVAAGTPWVNISQRTAQDKARAVGTGYHLITEPEWMTIATDVSFVDSNWSGGTVGSGYIYSGHNDDSPANTLAASTNDSDGYYGTGDTSGNQRRTLTLSNGEVIWDFAGNVWQWTDAIVNAQETPSDGTVPGTSGGYIEYTAVTAYKGLNYLRPPVEDWSSLQGIGQLYTDEGDTEARGFLRGGNWSGGAFAGVFALYLNIAPASTSTIIGFRVAR